MSEELNMTPKQTLAFFASVIKSGEPWTGTCQKAYDEAMAALASPMTALTPAAEEGERPDVVSRLHAEIVYARTRGHNGRAMLLEAAKAEIERLRALLSSPRVERAKALEEAAKVAEEMAGNLKHLGSTIYPHVQIGSHLETCKTIAKAIRQLGREQKGFEQ